MARDVSLAQKDTSYHSALMQKKKKAWDDEERQQQVDKDRREAALIASAIARTHASLPQPGEKRKEEEPSPKPPPPPNPWSKLTSPDGLTYYYNAITKGKCFGINILQTIYIVCIKYTIYAYVLCIMFYV